jgi:hypothetical protein
VLLRDGVPLATVVAGEVAFTPEAAATEHGALRRALLREVEPAPWALPLPAPGG